MMTDLPLPSAAFGADAPKAEPSLAQMLRQFADAPTTSERNREFANSLLAGFAKWGSLTERQEAAALRMLNPEPAPVPSSKAPPSPDAATAAALRANLAAMSVRDREFATSLLAGFDRFGSFTERQRPYAVKLAAQAQTVAAAPTVAAATMTALMKHFQTAQSNGLKNPAVTIAVTGLGEVNLSLAGRESRNPGYLYVKVGETYAGKVAPDGAWNSTREAPAGLAAALSDLGDNLAERASAFGRETGTCCFCSRELTDPDSVSVGYGPVCATRYGLQHGSAKKSKLSCD
jgi:hypothetical protein